MQYANFYFKHACVSIDIEQPPLGWMSTQPSRPPSSSFPLQSPTLNLYTLLFVKSHRVVCCFVASVGFAQSVFVVCPVYFHLISFCMLFLPSALLMSSDSPACSEPLPLPHSSEPALHSCCSCSFMPILIAHINITVYSHAAVIHV